MAFLSRQQTIHTLRKAARLGARLRPGTNQPEQHRKGCKSIYRCEASRQFSSLTHFCSAVLFQIYCRRVFVLSRIPVTWNNGTNAIIKEMHWNGKAYRVFSICRPLSLFHVPLFQSLNYSHIHASKELLYDENEPHAVR